MVHHISSSLALSRANPVLLPISPSQIDDIEIVTVHDKEDLAWLNVSRVPVVVCDKDGAAPLANGFTSDYACSLHLNRGGESSSFLAYIVSRYESLPSRIVFLRGLERATYQTPPFGNILRAIQSARPDVGFVPLNTNWHVLANKEKELPAGTPHRAIKSVLAGAHHWSFTMHVWPTVFEPILHRPRPRYIRHDRGSQFVVRRELIWKYPKKDWQSLLNWIMSHTAGDGWSAKDGNMAMEIVWPILFQRTNDVCDILAECTIEAAIDTYFDLHANFTRVIKTSEEIDQDNLASGEETKAKGLAKEANQAPKSGEDQSKAGGRRRFARRL